MSNKQKNGFEKFEEIVLEAKNLLTENCYFDSAWCPRNGVGFYKGHFWYNITLNPTRKKKREYDTVTNILVKPYRITVNDVEQSKRDDPLKPKPKFHDQNIVNVAYDHVTANFHKNISIYKPEKCMDDYEWDFQLILAKNVTENPNSNARFGPGWNAIEKNTNKTKDNTIDFVVSGNKILYIKKNWYFPKITDAPTEKCDTAEDLANLINETLNEIYEK